MLVVENLCHYRKPVKFGMPLQLYTTHRIEPVYQGRLVFKHYLLHEKLRTEMAWGRIGCDTGGPPHQPVDQGLAGVGVAKYQTLK